MDGTEPPFNFPIRLDALLIQRNHWLIIEAKYQFSNADIDTFQQKFKYISENCDHEMVCRDKTPQSI